MMVSPTLSDQPRCLTIDARTSEEPASYEPINNFTRKPPKGAFMWSKEGFIDLIDKLKSNDEPIRPFVTKILYVGMTEYNQVSSFQKLYRKWKESSVVRDGVGRPATKEINEAIDATNTKTALKNCSNDSSAFKLHP